MTGASRLALLGGRAMLEEDLPLHNSIAEEEAAAAMRVLRSGSLSGFYGSAGENFYGGPEVRRLEAAWCERFQIKHAIAMNSATSCLMAAAAACDLGPGDEMIVPPFTMIASATAAKLWSARAVFADVRADTFTLDPESVARCITSRTKAIMAVNLFGQAADYDALTALARRHGLMLIEDNAQAPGALYRGRPAGTLADIGVFSLNCHKTIQCGEGGVACTNDDGLAEKLRLIRNHGEAVVREIGYANHPEKLIGFNFRMGELEAAIAGEQLAKLDALTAPRRRIAALYDERLAALPGLTVPTVGDMRDHVYYVYALRLDAAEAGFSRAQLVAALAAEGVPCFEGYCRPLYREPLFASDAGSHAGLCPVVGRLYEEELLFHNWLHPEIEPFADCIADAFEKVWELTGSVAAIGEGSEPAIRRG
ncbi:MAG: DegT/DnrJ/EryC1/StrS family aminotransferase [Alphaproteobacteria bacterium]|nr:DegT/DnrJ/EryC1/StrS family aminotransferase [Alphaproteobacteria bacterium]